MGKSKVDPYQGALENKKHYGSLEQIEVSCTSHAIPYPRCHNMKLSRDLGGLLATSQRREGVARFARELERRFGRIEDLFEEPSVNVITTNTLDQPSLRALFQHQACAVHVPAFYPEEAAAEAAHRLEGKSTQNWKVSSPRGLESSDVLSVGKPYNVAAQEGPAAVDGKGALSVFLSHCTMYRMRRVVLVCGATSKAR